jgi:hypothetical protein
MRRKNRKWVAAAVVLYLLVMWSAYRWGINQRVPEGNIFVRQEREGILKLQERQAREAKERAAAQPQPTGESRLNAAAPAFVAARYDQTHVVFMVTAETESRFSNTRLTLFGDTPVKVPVSAHPAAPLAGLQELWEPGSQAAHFLPVAIQKSSPGEQWTMNTGPDSTVQVAIERPVIAPMGCSLALGFLAHVLPDQQAAFAADPGEYFVVRRKPVESAASPVEPHIGELRGWKPSLSFRKQVEQLLEERMRQEVAKIDTRLLANINSPGATADDPYIARARPSVKEWLRADRGLMRGEGIFDYDLHAFRIAPDGVPRIFARARWKLAGSPVFLMTAWLKAEKVQAEPSKLAENGPEGMKTESAVLLSADSSWATSLRESPTTGTLGESLDFQSILNEFDADHDGWAELLIHSRQTTSTSITLYLYTDLGPVPMKTPLTRDATSPESCLQ